MKKVSLSGSLRGNVGKKDAKALRNQGLVPCVIYGGKEQVHFNLSEADFRTILFTPETFLIEITIDGKVFNTILKDVQYHPVGDQVIHADFYEIRPNKPVTVALPVKLTGTSPGVIQGGRLKLKIRKLKLKAMLEDIPEEIVVSIAKLKIGQSVKVKEIILPKVTMLDPAGSVVVDVKTARGLTAAELEEEEAAEAEKAEGEGAEGAPAEGENKE
jgi:large subunit ribosomal protein L25